MMVMWCSWDCVMGTCTSIVIVVVVVMMKMMMMIMTMVIGHGGRVGNAFEGMIYDGA